MTHALFSAPLWTIAGWTMLHTLWIGTAIGAFAWIVRRCVQSASANVRYAIALCCLAVLALSPLPIAMYVYRAETSAAPPRIEWSTSGALRLESVSLTDPMSEPEIIYITRWPDPTSPTSEDSGVELTNDSTEIIANSETDKPPRRTRAKLAPLVARLPWLWLIGTPTTLFLLAAGLLGAERLRRQSRAVEDATTHELLRRLAAALNIRSRVAIGLCDCFAGPILVGIVRPMILLPPAALLHWSPEQLEMVLLHELSHIRRCDNLVNLLQRLVEAVMFFVPAVWFISAWVRLEREHCCDCCVVKNTGKAREYAETLVELAECRRSFRAKNESLSKLLISPMAEHQVLTRVRQILKHEDESMKISRILFGSVLTLVVATGVFIGWYGIASSAAQDTNLVAESENVKSAETTKAENSDEKKASSPASGQSIQPIDATDAKLKTPPPTATSADKAVEQVVDIGPSEKFVAGPQKYLFTVRFADDVTLSSNRAGLLETVKVQPGDVVKTGEDLVSFNADDFKQVEIDFAIAQAKLESAKKLQAQQESLRSKGFVGPTDIDKVNLELRIAELEVRRQTLKLEGLTKSFAAPIAGKVVEVFQRPGKAVKPGDPIVRIANTDRFIVEGTIDVARTPVPKLGDRFLFRIQIASEPGATKEYDFDGKIDYVSPQLVDRDVVPRDSDTLLQVRGIIENRNEILRANMTGTLQFLYAESTVQRAPQDAEMKGAQDRDGDALFSKIFGVSFGNVRSRDDQKFAKLFESTQFRGGLVINEVDPAGPAGKAGIRKGDMLVGLDKWETASLDNVAHVVGAFETIVAGKQPLKFYILRRHYTGIGKLNEVLFGNLSFDQEYFEKGSWSRRMHDKNESLPRLRNNDEFGPEVPYDPKKNSPE